MRKTVENRRVWLMNHTEKNLRFSLYKSAYILSGLNWRFGAASDLELLIMLRNLNIGQKLTLTYGVMAGFVFLLVLGTTTVMSALEHTFKDLAGRTIEITREVENLRAAGLGILNASAEFALIKQAAHHVVPAQFKTEAIEKEELEERDNIIRSYHAAFERYSRQVDQFFPDEGGLRDAIGKAGTALIAGTDRLVALARQDAPGNEILKFKENLEKIEEAYLTAIRSALDQEKKEFFESESRIRDDIDHTNLMAWLGLGLVVGAIALLGGIMTRRITGPLQELTGAAEKLGEGELQTRVELNRGDELGVLETAFNRMASSLQTNIAEREEAEKRLREAHRMQAIGQLTGGISHDFNNLLAVILGNAELVKDKGLNACDGEIDAISRAANRGAELAQRMLAYSRQQPLNPRAIDLAAVVHGLSDLLQRSLGETIDITISEDTDLWLSEADLGQVENALLNLALNARDAMPEGGKLSIESSNTRVGTGETGNDPEFMPGDYVVLNVTDTGTGMSSEVMTRAFEPFFTTKGVGEGSGLGLSMIYGFAKQSGGQVTLHSEVGHGTTVRLYLPRAAKMSGIAETDKTREIKEFSTGRGESVLVVEDDESVLDIVKAMLQGLGYKVHFATTAAHADKILEREKVDLVLSDVVLPGGESGPEFAQRARAQNPSLKVIFMSGYPANFANGDGAIGTGDVLLGKPFKKHVLASALRDALA